MSPPQQPTTINPNSLKIRLAYRFLHSLNNLNSKRSNLDDNQIHQQTSHRIKISAYSSMAYVTGSRRAWSRAILKKIRNREVLRPRINHRLHARFTRKRNSNYPNPKREYLDPFGNSGQEVKLRKLVPGAETLDACDLLDETADYVKSLATLVEVMKNLVDLYSTI
ncbi:hypothetical protein R6Q59_026013 [Mikania micrantha]